MLELLRKLLKCSVGDGRLQISSLVQSVTIAVCQRQASFITPHFLLLCMKDRHFSLCCFLMPPPRLYQASRDLSLSNTCACKALLPPLHWGATEILDTLSSALNIATWNICQVFFAELASVCFSRLYLSLKLSSSTYTMTCIDWNKSDIL